MLSHLSSRIGELIHPCQVDLQELRRIQATCIGEWGYAILLFCVPIIGSTVAAFVLIAVIVGIYDGAGDFFGPGHRHHFVSGLVFGQSEDRVRGVSRDGARLCEKQT
jgi:hypothetical protein